MRAVVILVVCLLLKNSLQRVQFYNNVNLSENQRVCLYMLLDGLTKEHQNLMIFSTELSYPESLLADRPVTNFNEWSKLRDAVFVKSGSIAIFLEGNEERDLKIIQQLTGAVIVNPISIVCVRKAICNSKMYQEKILETVPKARLHYAGIDADEVINLYAHTLLREGKCGIPQLIRFGGCSHDFVAPRFWEWTMNFNKCPIQLVTCHTPPYSMDCSGTYFYSDSTDTCGIEGMVMELLISKLNATGQIYSVGEPSDIRQLVANEQADIGFAKLDARPYTGISNSFPYLFVRKSVAASLSLWDDKVTIGRMIVPFRSEVWIAVAMVLLTTFIFIKVMPGFGKIGMLQIYGALITLPIHVIPRRTFIRIYLISIIIGGYLCAQSYLANLTKGFAANPKYVINTLQDLENSAHQVTGYLDGKTGFKDDFPRIYDGYKVEDYPMYFHKLELLRRGELDEALFIEETIEGINSWTKARALEDSIGWCGIGILVPNTSILLKSSNRIFGALVESGIVDHIKKDIFRPLQFSPNSQKVISLEEFLIVFYVLILGLTLSFLVFLIELAMPTLQKKYKSNRKWKEFRLNLTKIFRFRGFLPPRH